MRRNVRRSSEKEARRELGYLQIFTMLCGFVSIFQVFAVFRGILRLFCNDLRSMSPCIVACFPTPGTDGILSNFAGFFDSWWARLFWRSATSLSQARSGIPFD